MAATSKARIPLETLLKGKLSNGMRHVRVHVFLLKEEDRDLNSSDNEDNVEMQLSFEFLRAADLEVIS